MIKGIDISHYQNVTDWNAVKNDGVSFVFLKATEGTTYLDKTFAGYCAGARAVGLEVGAYHFARFTSKEDAIAEAKWFVQNIQGKDLTLPYVLDIETKDAPLSKAQMTECVNTWLDYVKQATGQTVMVYTYKSFLVNFDRPADALFWYARYGVQFPDVACDFWQYSDKGKVAGIASSSVDMNYFYGDKLPTINGGVAPVSKPTPTTTPNTNVSLVDYLVSIGQDASFAHRKQLAQDYGIANYSGTAEQNLELLAKLKAPKPALPTGVLKRGSKGEAVKQLQTALNTLHFKCGAVDGDFGAKTEDAVRRFQMVYDAYHVDGIYGSRTRNAMLNLL